MDLENKIEKTNELLAEVYQDYIRKKAILDYYFRNYKNEVETSEEKVDELRQDLKDARQKYNDTTSDTSTPPGDLNYYSSIITKSQSDIDSIEDKKKKYNEAINQLNEVVDYYNIIANYEEKGLEEVDPPQGLDESHKKEVNS